MEVARILSSSDGETWYQIDYNERDKKYSCNCAHFFYRGRMCKHIKNLKGGLLVRGEFNLSPYGEKLLPFYEKDKEFDL